MKKNRINPIEQHFEKVILAGVSVVLLGVVSMQFLTQPNAVKVGNSAEAVAPHRVFESIENDAEALLAQMRNPEPSLPSVPDQDVLRRFEQVRTLSLAGEMKLGNFGKAVAVEGPEGGLVSTELAATTYAMPALPVPASVAAATHRGTIDPFEAIANEALLAYLPAEQPFDALAVSVEGMVDSTALIESLQKDPDGEDGPVRPLPLSWWRGNLDMLGVEVQREELASDGSWAGQKVIAGMPGGVSVLDEVRAPGITPAGLTEIAQSSRQYLREIAQPAFPRTIAGPDWIRPSEQEADLGLSDQELEISRLKKQLDRTDRQIASVTQRLEELGGSSGGGGIGNERTGRGGEGGGGGGGGGTDTTQRRQETLQRQLEQYQRTRERLIGQLADLGVLVAEDAQPEQTSNEPEPPLPGILEAAEMPVWVHDFSADPGKTYRYRMRVVLNNPLFGRADYLSEGQQASAESATIEGAWSPWSSPIEVETDRHFFVVSANEDDQLGSGPRAAVEVYEFYYGYWRKGSTTLTPGDSIHASTKLPENLLLWDPAKLKELGRTPTPGNPRMPGRGPEDFGRLPGGPEGARNERDPRFGDPASVPGTRGGDPAVVPLPEGASTGPATLDLDVHAMLLDVVMLPGADGGLQAVLRGPDGTLVTRDASADRSGLLYRRLAANAREGADQGRPEPDTTERQPIEEEEVLRDPGGGGGGPGGG